MELDLHKMNRSEVLALADDAMMEELLALCEQQEAEVWEREQRFTLWAERGGYAAGIPRPL